ncbi:nucleoside phosphorylase domain-containing protein [Podospora aff. communis PSN243]|uniref:Nucleoside phosphorylase domain-containing protein n=1 Tax=Podospora aff. communis PSN243 TaxID=3040156 RepID=A0AAV9GKM4_9PEZI|nr:nucleoside phosphorylase domain-containing protein [Podospora aff. communis PSN243]
MDEDTNSNLRKLRSRPLCIICGTAPEAREIAKALGIDGPAHRLQGHEIGEVMQGHTFYLGSFTLESGERLNYYITSSLRMGIQSFAVHAALLFNILRPRFVVHSGVCAADENGKPKMALRDVVFGDAALNYEEGKFEKVPLLGVVFRPNYHRVSVNAGDMKAFAEAANHPNYHYGDYLSGSAVRGDAASIFTKIRETVNRNAIALDMEASAFIQLCDHFSSSGLTSLGVVKGISDFGNEKKGHDANVYPEALANTALAIEEWVTYQIPAITWTVDESGEPGARLVSGYYENFVRRVLDNHNQGIEASLQSDAETKIPYDKVKGLLCVLPKGRSASFLTELGTTQTAVATYKIQEVAIGGRIGTRYLCYKAGYFIDWCRCVNALTSCEDSTYQVGVFERMLSKEGYFTTGAASATGPLALVVEWEEVIEWLEAVVKAEENGEPTPGFKRRAPVTRAVTEPTTPTATRVTRSPKEGDTRVTTRSATRSVPQVRKKVSLPQFWSLVRGKSADRTGVLSV